MDIVLSKNGVKCAVFKIYDVQRLVLILYLWSKINVLKLNMRLGVIMTGIIKHFK